MSTIANTPQAWSERAQTVQDPWTACRWSRRSQEVRFEQVLWALNPKPGEHLLDYGCGTGEFSEWLATNITYTGYDTAVGMVQRAQRDHAEDYRTFTNHHPHGRYDLVAIIGPFNLRDRWTKEDTWHTIRHLWDTTNCRTLAVSVYHGDYPDCLSYDRDELLRCGRTLGHDHHIVQALHNDLMLVVNR